MKKIIACLFAFTFFVPAFFAPRNASSQDTGVEPATPLPLENLAIDESVGKVEERFSGTGDRTLVQVQDVHAHYDAQENIAAILEHLSSVYGIKKVALEGAWTLTDLPKSRAIPTSREKQLLARSLMEEDLITGPVYAAILSPAPITLIGIEDPALYEKNRQLFLKHAAKEGLTRKKLSSYWATLQALQKSSWNPELLAFGEAFGKFRESSDLGGFLTVLFKAADDHAVDLSGLSQIVLVRNIMALEKEVSKEKLEAEVKNLLREYKNTSWNLEELIRGGKIQPEKAGSYPQLAKLSRLYKMRDGIVIRDLMTQVRDLTGRVLWTIVRSKGEENLWDKTERFYLARRILLLEAVPLDLAELEKERMLLDADLQEAGLGEEMGLSLEFYAAVKQRDEVFFEKLRSDPLFSGSLALVTGGFHTAGLSGRFREAGVSYATISPSLGKTSANKALYAERMKNPLGGPVSDRQPGFPSTASGTLSELQNSIAWIDERFADAYEILRQTRDVRKAVAAFKGAAVAVSSSEKISSLKARGLLRRGTGRGAIGVAEIQETEFMEKPREEQLRMVRNWVAKGPETRSRAMLVSSVSAVKRMLEKKNVPQLIEQIAKDGDTLTLWQDVPTEKVPELLWRPRGIERIKAESMGALIEKDPHFRRLAKNYPFAIMREGYKSDAYVVLPELPVSFVLYRIVTLNSSLYQASKNPEFLALLQSLVTEILSQELTQEAA